MPQLQTRYVSDVKGYPGSPAAPGYKTRAAFNDTGNVLPFGQIVVFTGTELNVDLPSATGQKPAGIVLRPNYYEDTEDTFGNSGVPSGRTIILAYCGLFWVNTETAGTINSDVFYRHTAGGVGETNIGLFRATTDANADEIAFPNARWLSTPTQDQIAKISLNLA